MDKRSLKFAEYYLDKKIRQALRKLRVRSIKHGMKKLDELERQKLRRSVRRVNLAGKRASRIHAQKALTSGDSSR